MKRDGFIMKKIYLLRHCEYANPRNLLVGRLPVELSLDGVKHAERLAEYFSDKKIEKIYSSAVKRCQQTSEIISRGKIAIENDQRILETFSAYQGYWGGWDGKELVWDDFFIHRDTVGGEGAEDISQRMTSFFRDLAQKPEKNIIICSHGDPLYLLFLSLIGKTFSDTDIYSEPEGYQPKGSIRLIHWQDEDNFEIDPILEI